MNKTKIIFIAVQFAAILSSATVGFFVAKNQTESQTKKELQTVINWNTKQIHSLGVVAGTDSHNSEIIIQILNKLQGYPVKPVPDDITLGDLLSDNPTFVDNDVPITFEQVFKDQREVDRSIRALAGGNLFKAEALLNILEKARNEMAE